MQIIEDRRALHRIPELDRDLPKTLAYVRASLEKLSCLVFAPVESALCAFFDFGKDSAIAFRADMDALPITERTGLPFASEHPGRMHACGHDGHTAILLEVARRLDAKETMPHNVLLVFQSGEEMSGGAKIICETGVFTQYKVEAIFGLHLWPELEEGVIHSRENELMSRSSEVHIRIEGKSAHIAKREAGIDALEAGFALYASLRELEASFPKDVRRILNFGHMESGTVLNAVSGFTKIDGTMRVYRDDVFEKMQSGIRERTAEIDRKYGTRTQVGFTEGYYAVMNPPALYRRVKEIMDFAELAEPVLPTEDFSWYQRYIPGLFFFLGIGDVPPLHADDFHFNEAVLSKGADFFEALAERF